MCKETYLPKKYMVTYNSETGNTNSYIFPTLKTATDFMNDAFNYPHSGIKYIEVKSLTYKEYISLRS